MKADSHYTESRQETDNPCNTKILFNAVLHDFRKGHEAEHRREVYLHVMTTVRSGSRFLV
jgi:hypothetical protein